MAGVTNLSALFPPSVKRAGDQMTGALDLAAEVQVASAATTPIGAAGSNNVQVTGTTAITAFDTAAAGVLRYVRFAAALTLTYNTTSLVLPGKANITTQAGDIAEFRSLGGGNWICQIYTRASGVAVVAPAATFSVTSKLAKSAAFSASDANGTLYDLTGSSAATLPAASGAAVNPIWYHFRKRDGSGVCTIALTGSDTWEDGTTAPKSLYQEACTVYALPGANVWAFAPGTRQRGWVDVGSFSVTSGTASVSLTAGAGDAEIRDVEVDATNIVLSSSGYPSLAILQGGSAGSLLGEAIYGSSTTAASTGITGTSVPMTGGTTANPQKSRVVVENIQSTVANGIGFDIAGSASGLGRFNSGFSSTAGAMSSLTITPSAGTITSMLYNVRLYRP